MNEQAHIVISGRDTDLMATRGLVLQSAGHRVSTTLKPIQELSGLKGVHMLILCHTLSEAERRSDLDALAKASPETKVLCLQPYPGEIDTDVAGLDSFAGPREMMRVVNRLLSAGCS